MSKNDVTAIEIKRISQAGQVLVLMASGSTQVGACRKVGIDVQTFRYWLRKSEESLTELRKLADEISREEMAMILLAQEDLTEKLIADATKDNADPKMRLDIKRYLDARLEKIGGDLKAQGKAEDAAADYLAGPQLKEGESRFKPSTVNISPKPDGSIDVTTFVEDDIVDAHFVTKESEPEAQE